MIEIIAAVSAAGKAFNYIQQAVNKGHEINELAHKFGAFFDAKDKIAEAEASVENASAMSKLFAKGSVESAALQITMAKQKTMQMEKQLREIIVMTVGEDVYIEMKDTSTFSITCEVCLQYAIILFCTMVQYKMRYNVDI